MKTPKVIFFDAGNTIFYFDSLFLKKELAKINIPLDAEKMDAVHPQASRNLGRLINIIPEYWERYRVSHFHWFELAGMPKEHFAPALEVLRYHSERYLFWCHFPIAIRQMLVDFKKQGIKLGIISNAEGQVATQVRHLEAESIFDTVIDSHVVGVAKPDPKIFEIALESVKEKPEEAWHVGDMYETDVAGARAAGLTPILFDAHDHYPQADCIRITQMLQLKDILL
ncbi:MAG: HAD-IA family hydrolase [Deltaproteobacteria bacterium]|nr:HAD-IA family hydrolase [Deltaproteobacteria bacterium]